MAQSAANLSWKSSPICGHKLSPVFCQYSSFPPGRGPEACLRAAARVSCVQALHSRADAAEALLRRCAYNANTVFLPCQVSKAPGPRCVSRDAVRTPPAETNAYPLPDILRRLRMSACRRTRYARGYRASRIRGALQRIQAEKAGIRQIRPMKFPGNRKIWDIMQTFRK